MPRRSLAMPLLRRCRQRPDNHTLSRVLNKRNLENAWRRIAVHRADQQGLKRPRRSMMMPSLGWCRLRPDSHALRVACRGTLKRSRSTRSQLAGLLTAEKWVVRRKSESMVSRGSLSAGGPELCGGSGGREDGKSVNDGADCGPGVGEGQIEVVSCSVEIGEESVALIVLIEAVVAQEKASGSQHWMLLAENLELE
ncbi:hypothetical protein GE061_011507 [Apolygus lucorum]|uniref:Uncharacterized protein n=1 Tax=Apolygus lucorum TaxID=248454 RepID=A0A8S9Y1P7_APOLU|nr:hypothetical protein GE061_011507 [Apolygus lucorum]